MQGMVLQHALTALQILLEPISGATGPGTFASSTQRMLPSQVQTAFAVSARSNSNDKMLSANTNGTNTVFWTLNPSREDKGRAFKEALRMQVPVRRAVIMKL
jgi:hypothetical protein